MLPVIQSNDSSCEKHKFQSHHAWAFRVASQEIQLQPLIITLDLNTFYYTSPDRIKLEGFCFCIRLASTRLELGCYSQDPQTTYLVTQIFSLVTATSFVRLMLIYRKRVNGFNVFLPPHLLAHTESIILSDSHLCSFALVVSISLFSLFQEDKDIFGHVVHLYR